MKLFFDGGCRPNPGQMEAAVFAAGQFHHRPYLGLGTSEEAEWLALLFAVEIARDAGWPDIVLLGDSASVINQARGAVKCRNPKLHIYQERLGAQSGSFERLRIRHVPRTKNLAGIALARLASGADLNPSPALPLH